MHFLQLKPCVLCVQTSCNLTSSESQLLAPSLTHALHNIVACVLANNAEEEVQMILGARKGHVYLTCWPDTQSAVRPPLTADPGLICRVREASVWQAAHLNPAETLLLGQTESLLVPVKSSASICIQLWLVEWQSWQAAMSAFTFQLPLEPVTSLSLPMSGKLSKTGDSPVFETTKQTKRKKKKHKAKH